MALIDPSTITTYLICAAPLQAFKSAILIPRYINYARGKNLDEKAVDDESFPMYALPFGFDALYFFGKATQIAVEHYQTCARHEREMAAKSVKFERADKSGLENKINKNF